jgi:Secretion system C-terminal sorting domain
MKRFLLSVFISLSFFVSKAATITWTGAGLDGFWSNPLNWFPMTVPVPGDDVILDNTVFVTSYVVTLPSGAVTVSVNTLTITPAAGVFITLGLPSGNTADPGFTATGPGDAIVLNDRAAFFNSSGAGPGSTPVQVTGTNFFRINNGGRYIHNTLRGHTTNLVERLSSVPGTENGSFEFDVPGGGTYSVSASNRTYGNLTFLAFASGTITYLSTGTNPLTVNGDLYIYGGATYIFQITDYIDLKGDLTIASAGTFIISDDPSNNNTILNIDGDLINDGTITETGTGLPVLELNGTTNQKISGTGTINNTIGFTINNSAGATLNSPLTLPYNLNLTLGKITTTSTNLLTMVDNVTYTGGSTLSFVDGPLKKIGDESFLFPVGKGSMFVPIGTAVVTGGAVTDAYTAEYLRINPQSVHGTNYAPGINHISYVEYWTLEQNAGTATARVVINVHQYSFCLVPATTFISRWDGVGLIWTNEPATATGISGCGLFQCFNLTSNADVSGFGEFTLATSDPFSVNPLPIKLISFNAVKVNSSIANLTWELAVCCSDAAKFEVQKSTDSRNFSTFTIIPGSLTNRFYNINDSRLGRGLTYYRLKMIDVDGSVSYSKIVAIVSNSNDILISSLAPNPVHNIAKLVISTGTTSKLDFKVYNMSGMQVKQWKSMITEGNNIIEMNVAGLPAGMYNLFVSNESTNSVSRFIKQ